MEFRDNPLSAPFFVPGIFSTFDQGRLKKTTQQRLSSPTSKTNIDKRDRLLAAAAGAVTLGCSPDCGQQALHSGCPAPPLQRAPYPPSSPGLRAEAARRRRRPRPGAHGHSRAPGQRRAGAGARLKGSADPPAPTPQGRSSSEGGKKRGAAPLPEKARRRAAVRGASLSAGWRSRAPAPRQNGSPSPGAEPPAPALAPAPRGGASRAVQGQPGRRKRPILTPAAPPSRRGHPGAEDPPERPGRAHGPPRQGRRLSPQHNGDSAETARLSINARAPPPARSRENGGGRGPVRRGPAGRGPGPRRQLLEARTAARGEAERREQRWRCPSREGRSRLWRRSLKGAAGRRCWESLFPCRAAGKPLAVTVFRRQRCGLQSGRLWQTGGQDAARLGNSGGSLSKCWSRRAASGPLAVLRGDGVPCPVSCVPARCRLWPRCRAACFLKQGREETGRDGTVQSRLLSPQPHVATLF